MSIDVDVFPTKPELIYWGVLKERWQALLGSPSDELLGKNPTCHFLGTDEPVNDNSQLLIGSAYYFRLTIPNTVGLTIVSNSAVGIDEKGWLEDYGRNLTPDIIEKYSVLWKAVGYCYFLESMGGRSKQESKVLIPLTSAIAELCSGNVVISSSNFDLGVGVYSADAFLHAFPNI